MNGYYQKMLEEGKYYQDYVIEKLYDHGIPLINYGSKQYQYIIGENKAGVEIKYDKKFRETGNFWIELQEKTNKNNDNFIASGINREDNTWLYIIGDLKEIYIYSKKQLKLLKNEFPEIVNNMGTSVGYLLPVNYQDGKYVLLKIEC